MSTETTDEQDKTLPKMIGISTAVEIGGFFKNLGELKASVDKGFEKYGDREHAVNTIEDIARKHGLALRWE